jgi:hypothetical protein
VAQDVYQVSCRVVRWMLARRPMHHQDAGRASFIVTDEPPPDYGSRDVHASEQKRMSSRQYTDGGSKKLREVRFVCCNRSLLSVFCSATSHFIHVTDNFCHLFCPFSQAAVPWSSPAAPDFLSPLSSHLSPLCSILLALISPLLSSLFPLLVSRWDPLVYPPCTV